MNSAASLAPPSGRPLKAKLGRDDFIMRGYMLAIMAYLIVALAMPLYVMLSKSFSTYAFKLAAYEFQVSDEAGSFAESSLMNAEALNQELSVVAPKDLATSADGRLSYCLITFH